MKVILISPPYLPEYMRNARCDYVSLSHAQWYPIWLSYCGALLEDKGHEVKLIDAPAERLTHQQAFQEIINFSPQLTVVYSSTKSQTNDIKFAEKIKKKTGSKLVFVGPFVSLDPAKILKKSSLVDCAVKGEFEYPVLEIAEGDPPAKVKNLFYRLGRKIIQNPIRPLLTGKQLDNLPFVTQFYHRHLNLKNYMIPQEPYPFVDLFTGRGCHWGLCTFCLWVHSFIPGKVYNTRSIENVIEEIKWVVDNIKGVKEIFIQDDTLPGWRGKELAQAILANNLKLNWACYSRADIDYESLRLMHKSGCRSLHVGYESTNQNILNNIAKGITLKQINEFTQNANKLGFEIHGDFLVGLPGESPLTIRETINWAKRAGLSSAQFSIMNLYAKTPLYEYLAKKDYLKNGEPSYPGLSNEEIRKWAKRAYREFYFSLPYIKRTIKNPYEQIILRLPAIKSMLATIFWKRW